MRKLGLVYFPSIEHGRVAINPHHVRMVIDVASSVRVYIGPESYIETSLALEEAVDLLEQAASDRDGE